MFLATTALSEFWDEKEEILFLGSWCLRQDRRSSWEKLRHRVLPSPWNDRERFYAAADYLDGCGERLLAGLAERLNTLHGIETPARYWRVLLGPWLLHHLHAVYDRFIHLKAALDSEPDLKTLCLDPGSFRVPQDGAQHIEWVLDDPYNLQLYSELLSGMGYSFPVRAYSSSGAGESRSGAASWRQRLSGATLSLLRPRCRVALYETALPRAALWEIAWRTGFRAQPMFLEDRWPDGLKPLFDSRRNSLDELPARDEFERLFVKMLPQDFPSLYLEGYPAARERALKSLSRVPPVLLSGIGWHFHEPFKWVAAEAVLRNRRLVALQHGGGYGVYRATSMEQHEKRISDSFLVWGWGEENGGHTKNVPAPQFSSVPRRANGNHSRGGNSILFVATTNPLYFYRFFSNPQANQLQDYFEWQARFFGALPSAVRERVLFRPHTHPYPHGLEERWGRQFPDLRWDKSPAFSESLRRSSLAVIDHLGTPVLETLAADWPTILYWDPHQWETRPEAQPYFDSLRQAGILWDSPESAAAQLEKISGKTGDWWNDPRVRKVRSEFTDRYARSQSDWAVVWQGVLAEEIVQAGKS